MRLTFKGSLNGTTYTGLPVSGRVTSFYGVVRPELSQGKGHSGVDIAAAEGTPVLAPMDGVVNDSERTGMEVVDSYTPTVGTNIRDS